MDSSFSLNASAFANASSPFQFSRQPFFHAKKSNFLSSPGRKSRKFPCFASKDDANLNDWEQMELKFGRMIGEDPKVTLAKIMGRKLNPDMSYLEIEKLLEKKKGKRLDEDIEEIPFDVSDGRKLENSVQGLNLVRPVPKKGTKFEAADKPVDSQAKNPNPPVTKPTKGTKSSVPDVILRKPSSYYVNDAEGGNSSLLSLKPNLSLKMGKESQKDRFSDITLLKKPEPMMAESKSEEGNGHSDGNEGIKNKIGDETSFAKSDSAMLLQKPKVHNFNEEEQELSTEYIESSSSDDVTKNELGVSPTDDQLEVARGSNLNQFQETSQTDSGEDKGSKTELQTGKLSSGKSLSSIEPDGSSPATTMDTVLIVKPKRLDRSNRAAELNVLEEASSMNPASLGNPSELENFLANSPIKEREGVDWSRAEGLVKTGERAEVELISSSVRGFVASFSSLIGFLPYRNLAARWKFIAFESWLRRKGLDPSDYRQNLGVIGTYEAISTFTTSESSVGSDIVNLEDGNITSDMKLEDLLMIYDQEKLKFLSSFVGQKIKVGVVLADRRTRKLIFSIKPKEKEELVEKKRSLMAQLNVGDVVKCCIKKITYFGVFVEVEGVPALIHQTEVSWDATLDPTSYFKVGQIVDAKVHQLDFSLERIFLSLKQVTPDPLTEALEAVIGDQDPMSFRLEATEADAEWPDVESLIKELQQVEGIQSVSKGRCFLSPGLAPTFQVYMASMFENQYKLLARAGNRVQEVIVQTSLGKEELKSVIMTCTNRVE